MPFGRDTAVVPTNIVLDRGPMPPVGRGDLGVRTPSLWQCCLSPNYFGRFSFCLLNINIYTHARFFCVTSPFQATSHKWLSGTAMAVLLLAGCLSVIQSAATKHWRMDTIDTQKASIAMWWKQLRKLDCFKDTLSQQLLVCITNKYVVISFYFSTINSRLVHYVWK